MKKFLTALRYFFLALGLILLEQLPTAFITANQPFWQLLIIILTLLLVVALTVLVAKRVHLLSPMSEFKLSRTITIALGGFLALTLVKMLGGILLVLQEGVRANTQNQAAIEQLPPLLLVVLTVIVAPIVEEIVMRGLLMGKVFNNSYLGLVISSLLFGLLHLPTNLGSWVIYGGMGFVLGFIYKKTKTLEYTIMVHFLNNALGVVTMLLLTT